MIEVRKLAGALGAELSGVDLAQPLDAAAAGAIRAALLEHLVIFFHDQDLSPEEFLRFARTQGEPQHYPLLKGLPQHPEITQVKMLEHERANFGGIWHSDTTYLAQPPMGSILYALEVPPHGGDTMFANMYMAYERLSARMQEL